MDNFILFIRRFFNFFLFLTLEGICLFLISRNNILQGNAVVSSANATVGWCYKQEADFFYYFRLKSVNDSLMRENALLRAQKERNSFTDVLQDSMVAKQYQVGDSSKHVIKYAEYVYRPAYVINNSTNLSDNYITLNRGAKDGIRKNMAVISSTGIVGRVEYVTDHFSSVLSILSSKLKVSSMLKDGTFGFVVWDEKQPEVLLMNDVPQQVEVKKGDTVYTTVYSIFSPNIMIGTVLRTEAVKKNTMQLLYLRPSTNFHNLKYVYVIENKMAAEKKEVEELNNKK
jgi:rod shape-determining protein MreC